MKQYYERYWKTQEILGDFYYKWPVLKHLIPKKKNISILDFGCGKGVITSEIAKINPSAKIYGVDVSADALKITKTKLPTSILKKISDGGKIPFKNNFFDFIIAADVLEHVYDTENAYKELARVLKPKGSILISVPYNGFLKNILIAMFFFDYIFLPTSPHIRHYTKKSLSKCLKEVKLTPAKFGYFGKFYPFSSGMFTLAFK